MQTKRWALAAAAVIFPLAAINPAAAATASAATCSAGTPAELARCFSVVNTSAAATGIVRLTNDFSMQNSTLGVDPGVWLRLDLAGHRLTITGTNVAAPQRSGGGVPSGTPPTPAIGVPTRATLTIADSTNSGRLNATGGTVVNAGLPEFYPTAGTAAGIGTAGAAFGGLSDDQPPGAAASGTVIITGGNIHATGGSISSSETQVYILSSTGAGIGTGGNILVTGGNAGPVYVRGGKVTATGGSIVDSVATTASSGVISTGSTGAGIGSGGATWLANSAGFSAITANPLTGKERRLTTAAGTISTALSTGTFGSALGAGGVSPYCSTHASTCHTGTPTGVKVAVFDTHGGSAIRPQDVTTRVTPPTPPVRTGWLFTGWYTSATEQHPGTRFDFTKAIHSNIVIHAGWTRALPLKHTQ